MAGCASSDKKEKTVIPQKNTVAERSFNTSSLNEKNNGSETVISGLIENNGENFVLIQRPESRSRVSFILDVDENLVLDFEKLVGSKARVKVELTDASKTWTKYARVLEIIQ